MESVEDAKPATCTKIRVSGWGGPGGTYFRIVPACDSRIYAIGLGSDGTYLNRFKVWYKKKTGEIYIGGDKGSGPYTTFLFRNGEYINKVKVFFDMYSYVKGIIVYKNTNIHFSMGSTGGSWGYETSPSRYHILGFIGRSASRINQLGFYEYSY